jgi:hypothetical protein
LTSRNPVQKEQKTGTFAGTFSSTVSNFVNNLASPTGFEPESAKIANQAEEPDVIDISKLKKIGE